MNRIESGFLNEEHFIVQEKDGLMLYMPSHSNAVGNDGWDREKLWFRSRIENNDERTVSQGFGKFFNLGQGPDSLRVGVDEVAEAVRAGKTVIASLKYDGSCLIRSVYRDKVMLRTRGSFSYEHHDAAQAELDGFKAKYPRLFDPTWQADKSLLFEWVTPLNQIVIKYPEPALHLIGGVHHGHRHLSHLRYMLVAELEVVAQESGIPMMEYFKLASVGDWFTFYHALLKNRDIEGYVLRLADEQTLVKVKTEPYIAKHSLKSQLSFKKLVDLWLGSSSRESELIVKQIENLYDEEVVMWALPYIVRLQEAIDLWEKALKDVERLVFSWQHATRKEFAIAMQHKFEKDRFMFGLAMLVYGGKPIPDNTIRTFMERFDQGDSNEA